METRSQAAGSNPRPDTLKAGHISEGSPQRGAGLIAPGIKSVRSYVLRSRMTAAQKKSYAANRNSCYLVSSADLDTPINPPSLFPASYEKIIVEIGFGMGKTLALMAQENPGSGYIGIEVHTPGVARLLWEIDNRGLINIRIMHQDAMIALRRMEAQSVDAFHIFFPDPWPKKRHHKRRLLSREFLGLLCSRLKEGGYLHIASDCEEYAAQVELFIGQTAGFSLTTDSGGLCPRRAESAFEKKGREAGRRIKEIFCVKQTTSCRSQNRV